MEEAKLSSFTDDIMYKTPRTLQSKPTRTKQ